MGWFVIALFVGFSAFHIWRHSSSRLRSLEIRVLVIFLFAALIYWCAHAYSQMEFFNHPLVLRRLLILPELILGYISSAPVYRFLLGLAVGCGAAYILTRIRILSATALSSIGAIGLFLTLLAIVSPHLDHWLRNATSFKASVVEIQLANLSNARSLIVPDSRESFMDEAVLTYLAYYDETAERDQIYLRYSRPANSNETQQEKDVEAIRKAFAAVVSPVARCLRSAIANGLDVELVRTRLRDIANELHGIIKFEYWEEAASDEGKKELQERRKRFWRRIIEFPTFIKEHLPDQVDHQSFRFDSRSCLRIKEEYNIDNIDDIVFPRLIEFRQYPHLFLAASYLFIYTKNDFLALTFLQQRQREITFKDTMFPFVMSRLLYHQGAPVSEYAGYLMELRKRTLERKAELAEILRRCMPNCAKEQSEYVEKAKVVARTGELFSINLIALGIAQDIAAGITVPMDLKADAQEYLDALMEAIRSDDDKENSDVYKDTWAFLTLVLESGKLNPNSEALLKAQLTLEGVVGRLQRIPNPTPLDRSTLRQARAHWDAARRITRE
jgi:hypothetical protein